MASYLLFACSAGIGCERARVLRCGAADHARDIEAVLRERFVS
jgi:hypothetical protein